MTVESVAGGKCKVTFKYTQAGAGKVMLAGQFNGWNTTKDEMTKSGNQFTKTVEMDDGIQEYKFIVDGKDWKTDPLNPNTADDTMGGRNSVVKVYSGGAPPATAGASPAAGTGTTAESKPAEPIKWLSEISQAAVAAKAQNKKIFVFFASADASNSQFMEKSILTDAKVNPTIQKNYVAVKIDLKEQAEMAQKLGVFRGATIVLYNSDGSAIKKLDSIHTADELAKELQ